MREIKFRVWDSERNEMYHLLENRFSFGTSEFDRAVSWEDVFAEQHEELIPLQFTGLKDRNGKEIYEGDILRDEKGKTYKIKWSMNSNGFIAQSKETHGNVYSSYHLAPKTEVIGNIYEYGII